MLSVFLRDYFVRSPVLGLPILALVIFLVVFTGILLRTLWRGAGRFSAVADLPLDDQEQAVRHVR
jgi:cbb3-type cytochrome oxidase subunit 3